MTIMTNNPLIKTQDQMYFGILKKKIMYISFIEEVVQYNSVTQLTTT